MIGQYTANYFSRKKKKKVYLGSAKNWNSGSTFMASHMSFSSEIKRRMLVEKAKGSWEGIVNKTALKS